MSTGLIVILVLAVLFGSLALSRRDASFRIGLIRGAEQIVRLLPRMLCALIGAGFLVELIPTDVISGLLGAEAGLVAILIGACAGMLIPAGAVIAFPIAAVFANEGASTAALVSFITAWSIHALHRVLIYEIPLMGVSFLRLRLLSSVVLPVVAGLLILALTRVGSAL